MKLLKRVLPLAIFLSLCLLLYIGLFRDHKGELPSVLIGKDLPAFDLATVQNPDRRITEKDMIGEVALINVWATWCTSCRYEHPYLVDLAKQGVPIYGVNSKDDQAKARLWLEKLGNPYRFSVNDNLGELGIDLGVYGAPETYLIDAQGVIRFKHIGVVDDKVWEDEIEPLYKKLKAQAGGKAS